MLKGMVTKLQEAFEEVSKLPAEEQERWADWLLDEVRAEQKWDDLLARPESQRLLERLAAEAEEDIKAGRVADLTEEDFDP